MESLNVTFDVSLLDSLLNIVILFHIDLQKIWWAPEFDELEVLISSKNMLLKTEKGKKAPKIPR